MNLYLSNNRISFSLLAIISIALVSFIFTFFFINWWYNGNPFTNDIDQYYSYLNALFNENDLTFKTNPHHYWLIETPTHHYVPKVTYGMALFYAPFYLLAKLFSKSTSTGYEPLYAWLVHFGCIFYIIVGLWFTRKTLLLWFNELVTALTLILLFFGTNLFYYTLSESESVHGILFFLISLFLYHVVKWYLTNSKQNFITFCATAGLICLIRPTECLILLFPLLIGVHSVTTAKARLILLAKLKWIGVAGAFIFLISLIPQFIFWKIQSGSFVFFSYGKAENFFWDDPQWINVFFSYRKGLFIYSPLLFFSMLGFIPLYKSNKSLFYPVLLYFIFNAYLVSTWWDWSFGGSFGMRAFVHCFAILVIPFGYFINWIMHLYNTSLFKTTILYGFLVLSLFCCTLNLLQSNLYKHQIIHYDGMNKKAYQFTFFKKHYTQEEIVYLNSLFKSPDYVARRKGIRNE